MSLLLRRVQVKYGYTYYGGIIARHDTEDGSYFVVFDDGQELWFQLDVNACKARELLFDSKGEFTKLAAAQPMRLSDAEAEEVARKAVKMGRQRSSRQGGGMGSREGGVRATATITTTAIATLIATTAVEREVCELLLL